MSEGFKIINESLKNMEKHLLLLSGEQREEVLRLSEKVEKQRIRGSSRGGENWEGQGS